MKMSGWGKYPTIKNKPIYFSNTDQLRQLVTIENNMIARGMGRAYGDSSLNNKRVISTNRFNRMLSFDSRTGILQCQSGITLSDIIDTFAPQGWFLSVTPGTKFVSVGGAIASDVHGKNHHKDGSFSSCVESFSIMLADGSVKQCSKKKNKILFQATFGGMGLTGIVLEVSIRLRAIETAYIKQKTIKAPNLEHVMRRFEEVADWTYSVAWIDCLAKNQQLGRSVLMAGEHATLEDLNSSKKGTPLILPPKPVLSVPFSLPGFTLNKYTVKAFNALYYRKTPDLANSIVDYDSFFYPLDSIHHWNRIYGRKGFVQYQCVLPLQCSYEGMKRILETIANSEQGSFLAVLKLFGKQEGLLSFPMEGYTLALDFPINKKLFSLLKRLDEITLQYEGRVYLTKDARMDNQFFEVSYGEALAEFKKLKYNVDPRRKFQSLQSTRLGI